MAAVEGPAPPAEPAPGLPDYVLDPNAVLKDTEVKWRYGRAPDYSKTRTVFEETKKMSHEAGSLPDLVENLVKNWEIEASFKPELADWRTVDHDNYTFAINGGPPQSAEHMLKVGTYNAIIAPNEYYSPENSDFASSHKTFKRMMPTFAWEVIEVYSGPPVVAFKWRHWGTMKNDYVGFNDKGEKVTAKAHGGSIDIEGVTIAQVNDKLQVQKLETWFDPLEMFRQIAPHGVVNKEPTTKKVDVAPKLVDTAPKPEDAETTARKPEDTQETLSGPEPVPFTPKIASVEGNKVHTEEQVRDAPQPQEDDAEAAADEFVDAQEHDATSTRTEAKPAPTTEDASTDGKALPIRSRSNTGSEQSWTKVSSEDLPQQTAINSSSVNGNVETLPEVRTGNEQATAHVDSIDKFLERPADIVHPHPHDMEKAVQPEAGEAVAAAPSSEEVKKTHEEMSRITPMECPFLMNRE
ncbi:hypothetical protein W97_08060 [Coniosporium apollinis CBS 100218]|uniref:Pathogen-related protein n=1 Tax=Coniosporium apollinis (strain CBS 100218) TaxID=1168221 RepID=R7Z3Q6_CONA1|nr:uncharacterized protein W97_08060 [Coniosporium apollinis CBS 100218]EON68802.1 hypothetical protein W97_08060 [Coniosporium apollinis CBS 100218]